MSYKFYQQQNNKLAELLPADCSNREILLEWIFEICENNSYTQKSRELAVAYIDAFLTQNKIQLQYWQLLGITALSIALKFFESSEAAMMSNEDCLTVSGNQYTIDQLNEMEIQILYALSWNLNLVTPSDYIEPLQQHFSFDSKKIFDLVSFMNLNQSFYGVKPSQIFLVCLRFNYPQMIENQLFSNILTQLPEDDQIEQNNLLLVLRHTLLNFHQPSQNDESATHIHHEMEETPSTPKHCEVKKIKKHIRKSKN